MTRWIRGKRVEVDSTEYTVVVRCHHCGATFGPFANDRAARKAGLEHWDRWHATPRTEENGCRVPSCDGRIKALGLCRFHYMRQYRTGDPLVARAAGRRRKAPAA